MHKLGILIALYATVFLLAVVLSLLGVNESVIVGVTAVLHLVVIYSTARAFRVDGETDARRPWWKLTGDRSLSGLLSICACLVALALVVPIVGWAMHPPHDVDRSAPDIEATNALAVSYWLVGVAYLISWHRLPHEGAPVEAARRER